MRGTRDVWCTHDVRIDGRGVVKRYRRWDDGQHVREWRALRLLHAHAPGLAPAPGRAHLAARPPYVTMSLVPGRPLRGSAVTARQTTALAAAVRRMYDALPARAVAALPPRRGTAGEVTGLVRRWNTRRSPAAADPDVARALDEGMAWLATRPPALADLPGRDDQRPVLGPGDGNLANYLWDGSRVRVVDFEDAGRSDRPYELAEIIEHVSWTDTALGTDAFLGQLELSPGERVRLRECRRLLALVWLFLLTHDDPEHPRNPPGTLPAQAGRLARLL